MNSICCIFNLAAHYRAPIYKLLDTKLHCDFYITKWDVLPFKQMNYNELIGLKKVSGKMSLFGNFYWQKGTINLAFKPYKHYIMTGEPYSLSTWILLLILMISRKKTYLWTHGWYGDENLLKKMMKKIFFQLSSKVLLYGDHARNLMLKEGFDARKLICIYNSLDYDRQYKIRANLTNSAIYHNYFHNNFPVIVYIGRIQKTKKIDLLIQSINNLKKSDIICNLVIIGDNFDDTSINELISNYELDQNVWFYGKCYEEEKIGELIFNADVCVSPGNVGLTAMHSLVYGTPVITHDNFNNQMPEFEAIIKGENGDFFKENSILDLCDKIKKWISLSVQRRSYVREQCYKVIDEKYNPNKQIEIFLNTIKD